MERVALNVRHLIALVWAPVIIPQLIYGESNFLFNDSVRRFFDTIAADIYDLLPRNR